MTGRAVTPMRTVASAIAAKWKLWGIAASSAGYVGTSRSALATWPNLSPEWTPATITTTNGERCDAVDENAPLLKRTACSYLDVLVTRWPTTTGLQPLGFFGLVHICARLWPFAPLPISAQPQSWINANMVRKWKRASVSTTRSLPSLSLRYLERLDPLSLLLLFELIISLMMSLFKKSKIFGSAIVWSFGLLGKA